MEDIARYMYNRVGKELQSMKVLKTCMREEYLGNLKKGSTFYIATEMCKESR